jgi:hypothetical protein
VKSGAHVVLMLLVQLLFWRFWKARLGYVFRPRERFGNIAAASEPADAEPQAPSEGFEAARSGAIGKTVLEEDSEAAGAAGSGVTATVELEGEPEAVGTTKIVVELGLAWERDGITTTVVLMGTSRPA